MRDLHPGAWRTPARLAQAAALCGIVVAWTCLGDGLPGEYMVSRAWHVVHSGSSPLVNPAFAVERDLLSVRYAGTSTLGEFGTHELVFTLPLTFYQSIGVSWLYHGTDDYRDVDINPSTLEEEYQGSMITDRSHSFYLTYAVNLVRRLTLGANVQLAYQRFADEDEFGVGLDAGLSYRLRYSPVFGQNTLGVSLLNAVAPGIGSGYARSLNLSWHGAFSQERVTAGLDFRLKDLFRDQEAVADTAASGDAAGGWAANAEVGLWVLRLAKVHGLFGLDNNGVDHYGFAAGVDLPQANRGRDLEALFQVLWHEDGTRTYTWYALVDLGSHREERYARRKAEKLNTAPSELYNRALTLFYEGKYWDAYFALGRVRTEFPDFFRLDWVDYYSARCLEELGMGRAAVEFYETTRTANPRSAILPLIDLGLMRTHYRRGVAAGVRRTFNSITNTDAPDSLKWHAYYLYGESSMRVGSYSLARRLLSAVPPSHPDFVFAQFSAGIASVEQGQPVDALGHFLKVTTAAPKTLAEEELCYKAATLLGYLFLEDLKTEELALAKAVGAFRKVPERSLFYAQAQLGVGWAALRAQNWGDCIEAGTAVMRSSDDPVLKAEGALLVGYSRFYQEDYRGAQDVLEPVSELLDDLAEIPRQPPHLPGGVQQGYDSVSTTMVKLAHKAQSSQVLSMIDSLSREQARFGRQLTEFQERFDVFNRHRVHMVRFEDLRTDVDFILAKAISFGASQKSIKVMQKAEDKAEEIEAEIRVLQQQIKALKEQ